MSSRPKTSPGGADYYAVLGVVRTSDTARIRQAYRRLARRMHPDLNPNDRTARERYQEIQRAWEVLGDPERRAEYDRWGSREPAPAVVTQVHYGFAGFDFGGDPATDSGALHEIFDSRGEPDPGEPEAAADIHARVRVSFLESLGRQADSVAGGTAGDLRTLRRSRRTARRRIVSRQWSRLSGLLRVGTAHPPVRPHGVRASLPAV